MSYTCLVFPASAEEREAGDDQVPLASARGGEVFALPRGEDVGAGPASAETCLRRMSVLPHALATGVEAGPASAEACLRRMSVLPHALATGTAARAGPVAGGDALLAVLRTGSASAETTSPAGFFSTHLVFVGRGESGRASAEATGATKGAATEDPWSDAIKASSPAISSTTLPAAIVSKGGGPHQRRS